MACVGIGTVLAAICGGLNADISVTMVETS